MLFGMTLPEFMLAATVAAFCAAGVGLIVATSAPTARQRRANRRAGARGHVAPRTPASEPHTAAYVGLTDPPAEAPPDVQPDDAAEPADMPPAYEPGRPIVVTRVVAHGGGYGWVCAEDQRAWLSTFPGYVYGTTAEPVWDTPDKALADLRYHTEHECSALEKTSDDQRSQAIPAHLLYGYVDPKPVPPGSWADPATCPHDDGHTRLAGEDFPRCATCGIPWGLRHLTDHDVSDDA